MRIWPQDLIYITTNVLPGQPTGIETPRGTGPPLTWLCSDNFTGSMHCLEKTHFLILVLIIFLPPPHWKCSSIGLRKEECGGRNIWMCECGAPFLYFMCTVETDMVQYNNIGGDICSQCEDTNAVVLAIQLPSCSFHGWLHDQPELLKCHWEYFFVFPVLFSFLCLFLSVVFLPPFSICFSWTSVPGQLGKLSG